MYYAGTHSGAFESMHAASPACARAVLMAVVFSGGTVFTPSSTAEELPVATPLHTRDREVSACTLRALATCRTQAEVSTLSGGDQAFATAGADQTPGAWFHLCSAILGRRICALQERECYSIIQDISHWRPRACAAFCESSMNNVPPSLLRAASV
jgi:hypothetical protein